LGLRITKLLGDGHGDGSEMRGGIPVDLSLLLTSLK